MALSQGGGVGSEIYFGDGLRLPWSLGIGVREWEKSRKIHDSSSPVRKIEWLLPQVLSENGKTWGRACQTLPQGMLDGK